MARNNRRPPVPNPADLLSDEDAMDGPPVPFIDRRHLPRTVIDTDAWLAPADDTGAVRPPTIRTRDVTPVGLGFVARQDLSALGEAVLRLPAARGRTVAVACRVRRSLEIGNGWFNGLVEFLTPQPQLIQPPARVVGKRRFRDGNGRHVSAKRKKEY